MYVYIYIYICVYTYIYIYICIYLFIHIHGAFGPGRRPQDNMKQMQERDAQLSSLTAARQPALLLLSLNATVIIIIIISSSSSSIIITINVVVSSISICIVRALRILVGIMLVGRLAVPHRRGARQAHVSRKAADATPDSVSLLLLLPLNY